MFSQNDIARLVMTWAFGTESVAQMVWHYIMTGAGPTAPAALLLAVESAIQLAWLEIDQLITTDLQGGILEVLKWDFTNNRWDGLDSLSTTGLDGTGVGEYLPQGNSVLVKILTDSSRRQARKYVPGITEGATADGFITGANLVDFADFAGLWDAVVSPAGQNFSYCTFNTHPPSPLFETESLARGSVVAESAGSYQRRRKPGVGLT